MVDRLKRSPEYRLINPAELDHVLEAAGGLWYLDKRIARLMDRYFLSDVPPRTRGWSQKREELLRYFTERLRVGKIVLGDRPEYFNDDDRFIPEKGWVTEINTIVIHHTNTDPDISYDALNALGLLRLYVPVYRSPVFQKNGEYQPISSGHLYHGKQTFVGYHHLVRPEGFSERLLKDEYTGFQAGKYQVNVQSVGIAIAGKLENAVPTRSAIKSVANLICIYKENKGAFDIRNVLGHKDVKKETTCPGNLWEQWRDFLLNG